MDESSPTPDTPSALDCFGKEPLSITSADSEYDESLAVPTSLAVLKPEITTPVNESIDTHDGLVHFDTSIPINAIHDKAVCFKSIHRKVFVPGIEISVKIIDNERSVTANLFNPNLYKILLTHGDFKWTITKRYKHILNLHQQLVIYRTSLNIPFPSKSHKERRESFKLNAEEAEKAAISGKPANPPRRLSNRKKRHGVLPRFPKKPEVLVSYDDIPNRIKQLEDYLYNLCNITIYRNHHELISFLEVSNVSFVAELGVKGKEGMVLKKTGSTLPGQTGCDCCGLLHYGLCNPCISLCSSISCGKWLKRWFFIKETCFGYISPKDGKIRSVMLFDQAFEVASGMYSTGLSNGLQILNMNRQMIIRLWTKRSSKQWMAHLKDAANSYAREFTYPNPHHSFAPLRMSIKACSFIDGGGYLSAVADCIEIAKEEIYITDWWLSPEIYMKRPVSGDYWRLDTMLKRKADEGVRVYILLYKEVEMALGINSYYSKSKFVHDNIKVIRHPDHAKAGVFLWAHHEKIVCIDQSIAFVGGIDLCYGRWDDYKHRLVDLGKTSELNSSFQKTKKKTSSNPMGYDDFPRGSSKMGGDDETNMSEINLDTDNSTADLIKNNTPEPTPEPKKPDLPVLQPGDHLLIPPRLSNNTKYLDEHYNPDMINKKNIVDTITDKSKNLLNFFSGDGTPPETGTISTSAEKKKAERYEASNINLFFAEAEAQSHQTTEPIKPPMPHLKEKKSALCINDVSTTISPDSKLWGESKLWIGKDYANFIVKDFIELDSPFADLVDRMTTPRMPWHDIAMMVEGAAARDVARHFIQRWNAHKLEKSKKNMNYPYLLPKSYTDIKVPNVLPNFEKYNVSCQVLRSLTCWSGGFVDTEMAEQSIHEAYIESITRAQHYIYIENQFFITLSISSLSVRNQIGEALYNRIMRAHKANSVFRVFVVMPLLPAFEGEVGGDSGTSLHAITHWNYQSICRGKDSLISRLIQAGVKDPSEYVTFHGLRTHSVLGGEPVSELIYVHSKLMIVDDRIVICGSANINDRSMLGKRDSEVAVLIQDEAFEEGSMNGAVFPSGSFAGSLRKRLFREHLGMVDRRDLQRTINLMDPIINSFYRDVWIKFSQQNTETYEKVFHCIPTDSVRTFAELKKYQEDNKDSLWDVDPTEANNELDKIQGHLVNFPLNFLADETLTPPNTSLVGMMPTFLWT